MVAPGAPQAVPGDALTGARAVLVALHDPPEHYGRWWVTAVVRGSTTFIAYDRYPEGVGGEPQQHRWDAIAAEVSALVLGAETRSYPRRGVTAPGWTAHNTGRIHGPSASLVLSLALIDGQVPGRLGGALDVAATGRVTSFGTVDRVAGVAPRPLRRRRPRRPVAAGHPGGGGRRRPVGAEQVSPRPHPLAASG
jgi:hypothetical protein